MSEASTDQEDKAQVKLDPKPALGFQRSQLKNVVEVRLRLPGLYPSTIAEPFVLYMRLQLVKEAEDIQTRFLGLTDPEQEAEMHEYDAQMISILSVKAPTGFGDFPEVDDDPAALKKAIYDYFIFADGTTDQREAMAHLCRSLSSRYRRTVNPTDYL